MIESVACIGAICSRCVHSWELANLFDQARFKFGIHYNMTWSDANCHIIHSCATASILAQVDSGNLSLWIQNNQKRLLSLLVNGLPNYEWKNGRQKIIRNKVFSSSDLLQESDRGEGGTLGEGGPSNQSIKKMPNQIFNFFFCRTMNWKNLIFVTH